MKVRFRMLMLSLFLAATPLMAACDVFGILKGYDFCNDGYMRFATNVISGASYYWYVPGTSWSATTSSNGINLNHGAVPVGNHTMVVVVTCPGDPCTGGGGSDSASTSFTMPGICPIANQDPKEKNAVEDRFTAPFGAFDLARILARDGVFRLVMDQPEQSFDLVNVNEHAGEFYVFMVDQRDRLNTHVIDLKAGESRPVSVDMDARELYVVSVSDFIAVAGDQEYSSMRFTAPER